MGVTPPGVYRFTSRARPETVQHAVEGHGWRFFYVDGRTVHDKATFLRQFAQAMGFPEYFGHNWDAFAEVITDLAWAPAPGYLILYDHVANFAAHAPKEWSTALEILGEAVAAWQGRQQPMVILLRKSGRAAPAVPWL